MTYKEYYSTLTSIEEIKGAAADDILALSIRTPDLITKIIDAAEDVMKEKFNHDVSKLSSVCK